MDVLTRRVGQRSEKTMAIQQQSKETKNLNKLSFTEVLNYSDRGGIQTRNPHIRSVVLYSVELRSHCFILRVQR